MNLTEASGATEELTSKEKIMLSWVSDPYGPINKPLEDLFSELEWSLLDARNVFKILYRKLRKKRAFPMRDVAFSRLSQLTA